MDRLLREANPPVGQLASPKPQYKKPGEDSYEPVEGQHGAAFAKLKDTDGNAVSPATEDTLAAAKTTLDDIAGKDFATQTTLAAVKSELEALKSELQTIKANQTSGDQKVQLNGSIVDTEDNVLRVKQYGNTASVIAVVDSIPFVNTIYVGSTPGPASANIVDISKYRNIMFHIKNNSDPAGAISLNEIYFHSKTSGRGDTDRVFSGIFWDEIPAGAYKLYTAKTDLTGMDFLKDFPFLGFYLRFDKPSAVGHQFTITYLGGI